MQRAGGSTALPAFIEPAATIVMLHRAKLHVAGWRRVDARGRASKGAPATARHEVQISLACALIVADSLAGDMQRTDGQSAKVYSIAVDNIQTSIND